MNLLPMLKQSLRDKAVMHFEIEHPDDHHFSGAVIHIMPTCIVLRLADNFEWEGIAVIPLNRIRTLRNNAYDKCMTRVMQHNGQLEKLKRPSWLIRCETLPDILQQLLKRNIWPELDIVDGENDWFFIGPLRIVEEEGIVIQDYTAKGTWGRRHGLRMQDIAIVEFGSRYGKHFGNYMRDCMTK